MKFDLDIDGDVQVSRRLLRVGDWAGDARPVFQSISKYLMQEEERQFESEGSYASGGWAPLAASTVEYKARAGLDPRILHATLALRRSLTREGGDQKLIITDSFMVFGSNLEYAKYHQRGRGVPQRKPVELREEARREIMKRLQRFILRGEVL